MFRVNRHHEPALTTMSLYLCATHAESCTVENLICDESWKLFTETFRSVGRAPPRRDLTTCYFKPLSAAP